MDLFRNGTDTTGTGQVPLTRQILSEPFVFLSGPFQYLQSCKRALRRRTSSKLKINNKSPSAVRSGRKSCRVNMTVLLSFEEKTDDARACAKSRHCPLKERDERNLIKLESVDS